MSDRSKINARSPHAAAGQSAAAAQAQANAQAFLAAAPGDVVPAPALPARSAILLGTAPAPTPAPGNTIIKPSAPVPAPAPATVFDDPDTTADDAPGNPYLSLLGDGPATLTDTPAPLTTPGDAAGGSFDWLFKMGWGYGTILIVPAVLLLWWLFSKRR